MNQKINHKMNDKMNPNKFNDLQIGLTDRFLQEASLYEGLYLGRVASQSKDLYRVISRQGEMVAEISGKMCYHASDIRDYPAVGDFVMLDRPDDKNGNAVIHHILTRKSCFERRAAGTGNESQIVAANIDDVFLCMSLNQDFNLRRLERYLSIAWESGATPVVLLTKADLCTDLSGKLAQVYGVAPGTDVITVSCLSEEGYLPVREFLKANRTAAFIGSSGVGKSTLINRLAGSDILSTSEIRADDDKGRHTTTRRELILLPDGGIVIDTPGMRELGLEGADVDKAFSDIDELSANCRFRDCKHENEPGCAVKNAVTKGMLSQDRLDHYQKLKKEARYDGLNSRQIEEEKINAMFGGKGEMKQIKKHLKEKRK